MATNENKYIGEGYCVKCKAKRSFDGVAAKSANGSWMAKGPCEKCKTTVCRILVKNWTPGTGGPTVGKTLAIQPDKKKKGKKKPKVEEEEVFEEFEEF